MLMLTNHAVAGGGEPLKDNLVEQGKEIYQQYCQSCHGGREAEGRDDSWKQRNAIGELPPPPHGPTGHT
jgi:mono/diheme cytochrome c family protein